MGPLGVHGTLLEISTRLPLQCMVTLMSPFPLHFIPCYKPEANMGFLKRVTITIVCFFAAIGCYVFGIPAGGIVFFILGLGFEALFWFGIFGNKSKK